MQNLKSQLKEKEGDGLSNEFLSKISELQNSEDFDQIYKFFDEISGKMNQKEMFKACKEGLWKKQNKNHHDKNVLHAASSKGNLILVKSLIECGCDKESQDDRCRTALFLASKKVILKLLNILSQLELIKK